MMRLPPGPTDDYDCSGDLMTWMVEQAARHGTLFRATIFGKSVYVVSDPQDAEHVLLRHWQNYRRHGQVVKRIALLLGNGLISSNGEFWANQRRMVQPAFTRSAVSDMLPLITSANAELLDKWTRAAVGSSPVNVTRDVGEMVLKITLSAIFGEDYALVARHFNVLSEAPERDLAFAEAFRPLARLIVQIAARRRRDARWGSDILGTIMQSRDRDNGAPMSDAQLAREAMTLVVAGHETTSSALNWLWYLLAKHPQVQTKLAREVGQRTGTEVTSLHDLASLCYLSRVIDEGLRLYPPLWLMTRQAVADDLLGGYFVPAGTEIYIAPFLIQRDPRLWEMPESFDPDRSPDATERPALSQCPFGAGPRNCIGELFARTEMQMHFATILPCLRLRLRSDVIAGMQAGMNLQSRQDFWMLPELRAPSTTRRLESTVEFNAP